MVEKRNPGRFTIQFNMNDPMHLAAASILDRQGRHKAQFIVNAISFYQAYHGAGNNRRTPAAAGPPGGGPCEITTCEEEAALQSSSLTIIHSSEEDRKSLDEIFEEAELSAVTNTLASFVPL